MGFSTHGVKFFTKTVITVYYYWIFFFLVERIRDGPVDVHHAFEVGVIQRYDIINNDTRTGAAGNTTPTRNRPKYRTLIAVIVYLHLRVIIQ